MTPKAARAALDKKAAEVVVLDLRKPQSAFTDFFVPLASAANQKQLLVGGGRGPGDPARLPRCLRPKHVEGYPRGRSGSCSTTRPLSCTSSPQRMRAVLPDLERLWGDAERIEVSDTSAPRSKPAS